MIAFLLSLSFAFFASAKITDYCDTEDEFNTKFAAELEQRAIGEILRQPMYSPMANTPSTIGTFPWVDAISGKTTVIAETCPDFIPQFEPRLNDLKYRAYFRGNDKVVPLIACAELAPTRSSERVNNPGSKLLLLIRNRSDYDSTILGLPVFKLLEPIQKLPIYLAMAQAIQSVHDNGVIHADIGIDAFGKVKLETSNVQLRNFHYAGPPKDPYQTPFRIFKPIECNDGCDLTSALDIYMLALTITHIELDKDKLNSLLYKIKRELSDSRDKDEKEFIPIAIQRLSAESNTLLYPSADEDNLGKILQECLNADPNSRPSLDQIISRLTDIIARGKALSAGHKNETGAVKREEEPVSNDPKKNQGAKKLDEGSSSKLLKPEQAKKDSKDEAPSDNQQLYRNLMIGGIALLVAAVPIGFCLFKKKSTGN